MNEDERTGKIDAMLDVLNELADDLELKSRSVDKLILELEGMKR